MDDLVERIDAEIKRQRETRGTYLDYGTPDPLLVEARARIQALETSLAEARRQALEEAAKVAEELEVGGKTSTMEWANCMAHARDIAQAIRALADPLLDRQGSRP